MKQHISTFTKFVNEEFREPLAPTHEELENLESFQRLSQIGKIIGSPDLPKWSTQPRMYENGNRRLTMPDSWPLYSPRKWAFYPTNGTLITDDGYTRRRDVDYSTERGWNLSIDWIIIQCIVAIVDDMNDSIRIPAEMGIYQGETDHQFDASFFNRSLRGGLLDQMITAIGVGIGDPYDFAKLRSLLELIYEPISDREMILALSGAPVKLTRINK